MKLQSQLSQLQQQVETLEGRLEKSDDIIEALRKQLSDKVRYILN